MQKHLKGLWFILQKNTDCKSFLLLDVAGSIAKAAANVACPFDCERLMRFALHGELSKSDKIFESAIGEVCSFIDEGQKSSEDVLREKVDAIINQRYTDPTLSLTVISSILGMNSNYISGTYKKKRK